MYWHIEDKFFLRATTKETKKKPEWNILFDFFSFQILKNNLNWYKIVTNKLELFLPMWPQEPFRVED